MALQDLRIETLGEKHKKYNKLVNAAIAEGKRVDEKEFIPEKLELDNFMKIDLACNDKNIDYVLSVLKCKNILYVTRAINKSKWLVEDQYKHIINPQYLRDHLLPQMTTEAGIKLTKFVRQHLNNETRAEEFFKSETNCKVATRWLSRCSIRYVSKKIETNIFMINILGRRRLFEKSVTIFEAALKRNHCLCRGILYSGAFLVDKHVDIYLDAVEATVKNERSRLNAKATERIMKQVPERVMNKFEIYSCLIHLPTFVKYLKSEEIKDFLYKQVSRRANYHPPMHFFSFTIMKLFVLKMPKEERFDFVKSHFIDIGLLFLEEDGIADFLHIDSEILALRFLSKKVCSLTPSYFWYEFAPFEIGFSEIKKLLHYETNLYEKSSMLRVLLVCTANDMKNIQSVFSYYLAKYAKDNICNKYDFISNVIAWTNIYKYDDLTWDLLDRIFINMEVYDEAASTQQNCVETVLIHNILKNKPIPEVIEKKYLFFAPHVPSYFSNHDVMNFSSVYSKYLVRISTNRAKSVKYFLNKLSKEDGNKVFDYFYNHAKETIENKRIKSQQVFSDAVKWLNFLLNLLLDGKKDLKNYPYILDKIKYFMKINKENNWNKSLASLYNKKKSWRKLMFEESVILYPTQDVCVNALKHDPGLLERYKDEVEAIRCKDALSLKRLLIKLRIYWPNSLADDWSKSYIVRLDKLGSHKSLIRGICAILPQNELNDIIKKYVPQQAKIDLSKTDELSLSLQRAIAKNMHFARPQPSTDDILLYAKRYYLRYAFPSLLAIYSNLSRVDCKEPVLQLLYAPLRTLQKQGLRLAFARLDHNELKLHVFKIWNSPEYNSIRIVVFKIVYDLLRKEKNKVKGRELYEFMQLFISTLSYENLVGMVQKMKDRNKFQDPLMEVMNLWPSG